MSGFDRGFARKAELATSNTRPGRTHTEEPRRATLEDWSEELKEEWEERAAIMEYDGSLYSESAEKAAFLDLAERHLPEAASPDEPRAIAP